MKAKVIEKTIFFVTWIPKSKFSKQWLKTFHLFDESSQNETLLTHSQDKLDPISLLTESIFVFIFMTAKSWVSWLTQIKNKFAGKNKTFATFSLLSLFRWLMKRQNN